MPPRVFLLLGLSLALCGCAHLKTLPPGEALTPQERQDAIRRARVWSPTDIPSLDLTAGPDATGGFASNAWVTCKYEEKKLSGHSPKFVCETTPGHEVKVKYGMMSGTGLVVCAVCGPPLAGSIIISALPWSAVRMMAPPFCRTAR